MDGTMAHSMTDIYGLHHGKPWRAIDGAMAHAMGCPSNVDNYPHRARAEKLRTPL